MIARSRRGLPSPSRAFENVKGQIGACGIWCGSCVVGNGALRELSRRLAQSVADYDLRAWGPGDVDWEALAQALASIARIPVCPGCRRGGGREGCALRSCAAAEGVTHCADCPAPPSCANGPLLEHMRAGAAAAGVNVLSSGADPAAAVEAWARELRSRRPYSNLIDDTD
jgi:hypothetical protein